MRYVFQLAGGFRDHYTSRADFILFAKANPTSLSHYAGGSGYWAGDTVDRESINHDGYNRRARFGG